MTFQAFIFNWPGHTAQAAALERQLTDITRVTVINSDDAAVEMYPDWCHLGDSAYFSAQWNAARRLFDADVLFHIQADAACDDFVRLFSRAETAFDQHRAGVFEPNIDYTEFVYDTTRLPAIASELFDVPVTDLTCWFVAGDVVRATPMIDPLINKYGWGLAGTTAALARLRGLRVVRDYSFTIQHPRSRGYASADAIAHRQAYMETLPPELAQRVVEAYRAAQAVRARRATV
jgi:hypothetical protein